MGRGRNGSYGVQSAGPGRRAAAIGLSALERRQLGSVRLRANGEASTHPYPPAALWPRMRTHLLERSLKANPRLDPELTAYTPGETLGLLQHPTVTAWHERAVARLPAQYRRVVFVPCAKTKPWEGPAVRRSRLYTAYNALRREMPDTCFVTISEPLGVVPMSAWGDFPQYDNPGLFTDDSQRSGMTTREWLASPFAHCYGTPFDAEARSEALSQLGVVVGRFLTNNAGLEFTSVVDNAAGPPSTHGLMLDAAIAASGVTVTRYAKRGAARISPLPYLRTLLS